MKFRTELSISESKYKISHHSRLLCLGSCFAQNIGNKLKDYLFDSEVNPWGIAYNIVSICKHLEYCLDKKSISHTDLDYNPITELYTHPDFHSSFSNTNPNKIVDHINSVNKEYFETLETVDFIILSLGTSIVYKKEKDVVANCHKFPGSSFEKVLLEQNTQIERFKTLYHRIKNLNQDVKIILTVSPIRHTKEGLIDNQLSKSILRVVTHELSSFSDSIFYFPSYEIMVDDLRDYRFYSNDLIHPNDVAINYIWNKFGASYFDKETRALNNKIEKWVALENHKIMFPETTQGSKLSEKKLQVKNDLLLAYPFLSNRIKDNSI